MNDKVTKPHVLILGTGGGGVNLVDMFLSRVDITGYEDVFDTAIIDASTANVRFTTNDFTHTFLLKEKNGEPMEGGGQDRTIVYPAAKVQIPAFMDVINEYEYVIVVTTFTGGSGSLISNLVVKSLLDNGKKFVVLGISESNTRQNNRNAINTVTGLDNLARNANRPVVARRYENLPGKNRSDVDKAVLMDLVSLTVLFSEKLAELDRADLNTFLGYNSVTDGHVGLVEMSIVSDKTGYHDDDVLAVASLAAPGDSPVLEGVDVDVHVRGYLVGAQNSEISESLPIHFVISEGTFIEHVQAQSAKLEERETTRSKRRPVGEMRSTPTGARTTDDGIVL